jgi:acyl-CoA synthetase (AMP-forming)/AMP-acid ligase II
MSTLLARLASHAAQRPTAQAYQAGDGSLTYGQLHVRVTALAGALRQSLPSGAAVLLSCPNCLEYPIAFLGILAAGCTVFPVSPEAADVEIASAATQSAAKGIIGDDRALRLLGPSMRLALGIAQLPPSGGANFEPSTVGDLLLQSSGTTGAPKIVRRTGQSLDAAASAMVEAIGFGPADRVLMTIPLTHSYGLEHGLLAPIWAGSAVDLRGLSPLPPVMGALRTGGITILPGVPSTFEMLAAAHWDGAAPALRLAYSAGGPLPRPVFDACAARGMRVTQLYGASEIGSVTYNPPGEPFDPASVGYPMRDVSIRILDRDDIGGQERDGQIAIAAASMFAGYLDEEADLIDGHFPTGDLGYVDDTGRLFITGRIKLLIDVGGLKVNPLEVETVLLGHLAVEACVVVGVRQSLTVCRLKAIVTPRDPAAGVCIDELRAMARQHLAAHKIPRIFEVRDSLPRSATGKILRHLVEMS